MRSPENEREIFFHPSQKPDQEPPSEKRTAIIRAALVSAFTEGLRSGSLPFVRELKNSQGERLLVQRTAVGRIEIFKGTGEGILEIPTDGGAVLEGTREILTHELTGCLACFVFGEDREGRPLSGLIHLTPSSQISWGNYRHKRDDDQWGPDRRNHAAETIASALESVQADPKKTTLLFLGNEGGEPMPSYWGYAENEQQKKREDLARLVREKGFQTVVAPPLPFVTASLFWSPDQPREIFAVGEHAATRQVDKALIPIPKFQKP